MRNTRLAALALLLVVVACGRGIDDSLSGTTTTLSTTTTSSTLVVETTVAGTTTTTTTLPPEPLVVWVDPARAEAIADATTAFTTAVGVEVDVQTFDLDRIRNRVLAGSGEQPDLFLGSHLWLGDLAAVGAVAAPGLDARTAEFVPAAAEAFTVGGSLLAAPIGLSTTALYYRTDLVADAPAGFSQIKGACEDLGDEIDSCTVTPLDTPVHTWAFLAARGGYLFAISDGVPDVTDVGIDGGPAGDGADFLHGLVGDGVVSGVADLETAIEAFGAATPYLIAGPEVVPALAATGVPYGVVPLPFMAGDAPVPFVEATGWYLNARSTQPDAAAILLRDYLVTPATMDSLLAATFLPSAYIAVGEVPGVAESAVFVSAAESGRALPAMPGILDVLAAMVPGFADLYDSEADPAEALGAAAAAVRQIVGTAE